MKFNKVYMEIIILVLTVFLLVPAKAYSSDHLVLDEIIVMDSAISPEAKTASKIGIKVIERGKNVSVADVLKLEPEVDLKRNASIGDNGDMLSIRGLSRNRIMLNVNGRPVISAGIVGGYYIDWSTMPLDNISKIEVIKGGSSALYGNNAIGGVINLKTRKPSSEKPETTVYGNLSNANSMSAIQNYRLSHMAKNGRAGYAFTTSYQKAPAFLYNNDFKQKNSSLSIYFDMPGNDELTLGVQYADTRRGFIKTNRRSEDPANPLFFEKVNGGHPLSLGETISGSGINKIANIGEGAYWDKEKYYYDVNYKNPVKDGVLELKYYKNIENRLDKNYSTVDGHLVLDRVVESDRTRGGSVQLTKNYGTHEVIFGAEKKNIANGDIQVNYVDNTYNGRVYTGTAPNNEGDNTNFYIQDSFKISPKVSFVGGLRHYYYKIRALNASTRDISGSGLMPKLNFTYRMDPTNEVTLSVYKAERTPGLPEIYWAQNAVKVVNNNRVPVVLPELKDEKNTAAEVSFRHSLENKGFVKLTAYFYGIKDYIMSRFEPSWSGIYNIDEVLINGLSFELRKPISNNVTAAFNSTWQKSSKKGDSFDTANLVSGLDSMPAFKSNLSFDIKMCDKWSSSLSAGLRYVGKQDQIYTYGGNKNLLMPLGGFTLADMSWKVPYAKNREAEIYIENLFNKNYEERFGYPLMGRLVGLSFKAKF